MKLKEQKKMLTLNRETICTLNHDDMNNVNGGVFIVYTEPTNGGSCAYSYDCVTLNSTCLNATKCAAACITRD